jgi:hypothetical protein
MSVIRERLYAHPVEGVTLFTVVDQASRFVKTKEQNIYTKILISVNLTVPIGKFNSVLTLNSHNLNIKFEEHLYVW